MPEISRFLGMSIKMLFGDHEPPHVHILDSGAKSKVDFEGNVLSGFIPENKLKILSRWLLQHRSELDMNWIKVVNDEKPERIEPWE